MKDKIMYKLMFGIVIFMGCVMAYNTYLRFYPFRTVVINKVELLTPEIKQGGTIKYRIDYCRYTDAETTVYRTIQSTSIPENRYPLPATSGTSIKGCHVIERTLVIDSDIPLGEYFLRVSSFYQVNELQKSKVDFIIGNFIIK